MATQRPIFSGALFQPESRLGQQDFGLDTPGGRCANTCRRSIVFALTLMLVWIMGAGLSVAQTQGRVARIPAGTLAEDGNQTRWNQVVLLARPRIASGDVESLPKSVRDAVSSFVLTILATVEQDRLDQKYSMKEVGVGYSTYLDEKLTVITSDSQKRLGAGLGFIGRQMLKTNESQLDTALIVARTSTVFVFDTPSLMWRNGTHRKMVTRHFLWVDAASGQLTTLVWLIEGEGQRRQASQEAMRGFRAGLKEDRKVHVDKSEFLLGGIPTDQAFALESLPPGQTVEWSRAALELAALPSYSREQLQRLSAELNRCIQETLAKKRQAEQQPSN